MLRTLGVFALFSWWVVPALAAATPGFRIEGVPESSEFRAQLVADATDAYRGAQEWFRVDLDSTVTIQWVVDAAELGTIAHRNPGAVAGVAIPAESRILLFAPALAPRPHRIRAVIQHELCHLLFAKATARAAVLPPRWLNEGIAMWRSGEWDLGLEWRSRDSSLLTDAAAAGSLVPFRELDSSFPRGPFFHVAYAQSLSFVEWLVKRGGAAELRRFVQRLVDDLDPEPAFLEVWGLSIEDAEEEWRKSLGRSGWFRLLPSSGTLVTMIWAVMGLLVIGKFIETRIRMRRAEEELGDGWD
jgi:hypothetical protein